MSQELTNLKKQEVAKVDENVRKSQELSGQGYRSSLPFIPIITINNKQEKKVANIDGEDVEVKIPIKKGFIMNTKNEEGEYEDKFLSGDISGVILKERYMVEKKWEEGEDQYRSDEFDDWNELINLYDVKSRKSIFTGTYKEIKEFLPSSTKIRAGKEIQVKSYSLFVILYINLEDSGTIVRLKLKMTADNNWFDYRNSFKENETWAGYLTHFNLIEKKTGEIDYYYVSFERGEQVDLEKQLEFQIELNRAFDLIRQMREKPIKQERLFDQPKDRELIDEEPKDDLPTINVDEDEKENEIKIQDIPF